MAKIKTSDNLKEGEILEHVEISHTFAIKWYNKFWENFHVKLSTHLTYDPISLLTKEIN